MRAGVVSATIAEHSLAGRMLEPASILSRLTPAMQTPGTLSDRESLKVGPKQRAKSRLTSFDSSCN